MKNNIILTGLLFILMFTTSCDNDDYDAPYGDFSSFAWYTSEAGTEIEDSDYVLAVRDTIIFSDLSQNALSHEWIIPAESSRFVAPGGLATDNTVNIRFDQSGIHEVMLKNMFKDSVTGGVQMNQYWEVEKIFTIDVFADIKPEFKIFKGDEEILNVLAGNNPSAGDSNSWPTVTLEAGEELTYMDLSTIGRPDGRTWSLNGGSPDSSNAESASIGYYGLGTFEAGSVLVKRTDAEKPDGETTKIIPLKIEVIPSSQPFVQVGQIREDASEVISFSVSGQIATLDGEEGNFTVHVVNAAAGYDQNIAVQSASINSSDLTKVDLVLAEPIFNSDNITIEYTAGNIVSVDTRVLESFGPINVRMHENESIIGEAWAGYEVEAFTGNFIRKGYAEGYWVGAINQNTFLYYSRVTDVFNSGVASMRYHSPDGISSVVLQGSNFTKGGATPHGIPTMPAGTYKVSYMVYLEPGNTTQTFRTVVQGGDTTYWDVSTLPRGEWIEISNEITVAADLTNKRFDIRLDASDNTGVTGEQIMYFDDLTWRPIELR